MGQGAPNVQSIEIGFWLFLTELQPPFERGQYSERSWSNFANNYTSSLQLSIRRGGDGGGGGEMHRLYTPLFPSMCCTQYFCCLVIFTVLLDLIDATHSV